MWTCFNLKHILSIFPLFIFSSGLLSVLYVPRSLVISLSLFLLCLFIVLFALLLTVCHPHFPSLASRSCMCLLSSWSVSSLERGRIDVMEHGDHIWFGRQVTETDEKEAMTTLAMPLWWMNVHTPVWIDDKILIFCLFFRRVVSVEINSSLKF